ASTIRAAGQRAHACGLDVADEGQFNALIDDIVARHGRLDFLFNNAGINRMGDVRDLGMEHWKQLMDVNLWGVIHGTLAAYRVMVQQRRGHIVNVSSGLGITPAPRNVPYATTKAAVVGLSESLRIEARDLGVRVSVVCPGWIRTPMLDQKAVVTPGRSPRISIGRAAALMPWRFITSEQAARTILHGVAGNKPMIVFPFYVRAYCWLYHHCRPLTDWWNLQEIREFRRLTSVDPVSPSGESRESKAP
ncbi:MAG TPA: SDR family oxidoreductase, partial [Pirellulaceae bacterium]